MLILLTRVYIYIFLFQIESIRNRLNTQDLIPRNRFQSRNESWSFIDARQNCSPRFLEGSKKRKKNPPIHPVDETFSMQTAAVKSVSPPRFR